MSNIGQLVAQLIPQLLGKLPIRKNVAFALAAVPASNTTTVPLAGSTSTANGYVAKRKGSITGISAESSAAPGAGDFTVQVLKGGVLVAGAEATIVTAGTRIYATFPAFTYQYAANDKITCQVVASGASGGAQILDVSLELTE